MQTKNGLDPVIYPQSRILILGTLPGDESLRLLQYYADPGNQFWRVLERVYGEASGTSYKARLDFLERMALALWDVLRSGERFGSLDSNIQNPIANDFGRFFAEHRALDTVVFNGSEAEKLFRKLVSKRQSIDNPHGLRFVRISSTSATPGQYVPSFDGKVAQWKAVLSP